MRVARSIKELEGLATRMADSEEDAYSEFADTFGPRLKAFFVKRGLAASDAEDLAVSCVTDISLKVDKYKPLKEGGFEAWVFTLARHSLIDWLRSRRESEPLPDDLPAPPFEYNEDAEFEIDITLAVREAVYQLPSSDQALIQLRHLGAESTYKEIADQLNISPESARVRHFRAMKRLKVILEEDDRIIRFLNKKNKEEQYHG